MILFILIHHQPPAGLPTLDETSQTELPTLDETSGTTGGNLFSFD